MNPPSVKPRLMADLLSVGEYAFGPMMRGSFYVIEGQHHFIRMRT